MSFFITENGSILKYSEKTNHWSVLVAPKIHLHSFQWQKINTLRLVNLPELGVTQRGINDPNFPQFTHITLNDDEHQTGYFLTNDDRKVYFANLSKLDDINPALLPDDFTEDYKVRDFWNNESLRARAAKAVRELTGVKAPLKNTMLDNLISNIGMINSVGGLIAAAKNPEINSCSKLIQFADAELARLRRPFTFFAAAKIKAIEDAKIAIAFKFLGEDDNTLKEESYKQIAIESGLIAALSIHRFSWSTKAKHHLSTTAIDTLEQKSPGISKVI
jgi:hypothetical protein